MGGNGVSDSAGAGEGVGGVVNGAGLTSGLIARSGASGGGSTVGTETGVDNELAKVRGFRKVTDGGLLSQKCWSVSVIHKLSDSTPGHIRRQFETAYQLVLQS